MTDIIVHLDRQQLPMFGAPRITERAAKSKVSCAGMTKGIEAAPAFGERIRSLARDNLFIEAYKAKPMEATDHGIFGFADSFPDFARS